LKPVFGIAQTERFRNALEFFPLRKQTKEVSLQRKPAWPPVYHEGSVEGFLFRVPIGNVTGSINDIYITTQKQKHQ
jgi:hypothetical protein